ncbi:MAG TPA: hypothetical protein VMR70_08835 [Flavisolibacter sp.]|nr:hypothetical protein [Flavisolibacter sp.]
MRFREPIIQKLPRYLSTLPVAVHTPGTLGNIIADFARAINDPLEDEPAAYLQFLIKQGSLEAIYLDTPSGTLERYLIGIPSLAEIALSLKDNSYLSHASAAFIHGLINEEPPIVYVSKEGYPRQKETIVLAQEAIDTAFAKPQRRSGTEITWQGHQFLLLTGQYSEGEGVEQKGKLRLTDLERTLLDITVRPQYGRGANTVLQAYREGKGRIDVQRLRQLLEHLNYHYPYHQAIGFYLTRAGYSSKELKCFRSMKKRHRFYLDYQMNAPLYDETWQVYYPQDLT